MEFKICNLCDQEKSADTFNKHYAHCKKRYEKYPIEKLKDDYNLGMSLPELSEKYGISVGSIYRLFNSIQFKTRSVVESCTDSKKKKTKGTLMEKYGVEHNFQNGVLRKKWETRLFETEGITNVFQRESVKTKSRKTLKENYGVEHPMLIAGIKDVIKLNCLESWGVSHPMMLSVVREKQRSNVKHNKLTKIHKFVNDLLNDNGIETQIEYPLSNPKSTYFYDILMVGTNKIIEVNGDFWHFNPLLYKENDVVSIPGNPEFLVKDKWGYDKEKNDFAISKNFTVLVVWEYDLKKNKEETINKILKYAQS
jgi:G:T-mismatch repair DNA endonuclease (very short patch repair protein)